MSPRIVYLVSRFPITSETFIIRELDALARGGDAVIELRSLFPTSDRVVHDVARPWVRRLIRPRARAALLGVLWAGLRHPAEWVRILGTVVRDYRARPDLIARALVTVALACAHARDLARRPPPVHIHAHYATYPTLAAWVCRQLCGATYSFTVHAHDLYVDQSMLRRKVADAQMVVAISEYNRDLLSRPAAGSTPIHVVHCGIDTAAYPYRSRQIPPDGPVRALTVASLQAYKGHAVLFRALAIGGPAVDRITVDLIGDGVLRDELQRLAIDLGIAERIRFHGSRTESEVRAALADADLFILPSVVAPDGQMEGLPVALMEALASGVSTVSTALSGIPEIVVDGVTGMLARPDDPVSLRDALTRMVESYCSTMSLAGRELVAREFDLKTTTAELGALLRGQTAATRG